LSLRIAWQQSCQGWAKKNNGLAKQTTCTTQIEGAHGFTVAGKDRESGRVEGEWLEEGSVGRKERNDDQPDPRRIELDSWRQRSDLQAAGIKSGVGGVGGGGQKMRGSNWTQRCKLRGKKGGTGPSKLSYQGLWPSRAKFSM